jgi:hypothetical protein
MIAKSTKEYDAFGPWIFEIDDEYTMPPLFVKQYREKETPLMLIKIPRKIDRRDATPDMNLYDYVIGAFESYLYILKRVRDNVEEKRVSYESIVAIKNTDALLRGQMHLFLKDDTVVIDYNTVSQKTMIKLINIIRERYTAEERRLDVATIAHDINTIEHRYSVLIDEFKANDERVRLIAYQPPSRLTPKYKHLYEKVFALLLKRKFLASTAFITNDTELIVLERIRLKNRADFSCSSLFLPYPYITDVTMEGDIDNGTLSTIKLKVKNKIFSFLCGENNIQIEQLFQELTR